MGRAETAGHPQLDAYLSGTHLIGGVTAEHARAGDPISLASLSVPPSPPPDSPTVGVAPPQAQVWLTGTGTPAALPGRAGPSTLLRCGPDVIVVDAGNGVAYQLAKLGIDPAEVTCVFLTHLHFDHTVDLPYLILSPWAEHRDDYQPPVVVGPPGTARFVEQMLWLHEYDIRVRRPHGYDPARTVPRVIEVDDGAIVTGEGWACHAFAVDHYPVECAFGYTFEAGGRRTVISGDTRMTDNLIQQATGADLLIHEAIYEGYGYPEYHTLAADVGRIAAMAGVAGLALTHLIPGHLPDDVWLQEVARSYTGPTQVGRDLLQLR